MINDQAELIFPLRVIPDLANLRGDEWRELISSFQSQAASRDDQLAFVLLMVKLGGCLTCNSDAFRAMRGCDQCANRTIRRYRGTDHELIKLFLNCRKDVNKYNKKTKSE